MTEEEKAPYKEQEILDKQRYDRECEEHRKKKKEAEKTAEL
jgi:hypothetical protein